MKNVILLLLLAILPPQLSAGTILVLGDSISAGYGIRQDAGWVALLEAHLNEQYPGQFNVVNASVSGETTAGGLYRLPGLLAETGASYVVLELGGNDGLRGLSLAEMRANLQEMIRLASDAQARTLLLSVDLPASYGSYFRQRFTHVFSELGKLPGVEHQALGFELLQDRNLVQEDGIHPTEEAQPILFKTIWSILEPRLVAPGM